MPQSHTPKRALRWAKLLFFLFLVAATIWIIRFRQVGYVYNEGNVFGTTYHICYQSPTDYKPEIEAELRRVDQALSLFNPDSWLSHFNNGQHPKANAMADEVITLAMQVSEQTEGAFDITVAPLVNAWGFGYKSGQWPTEAEVDSLRQIVGYQRYARGEKVQLDCGAIAKGYGVDRVAAVLRRHGIENYMVEIGGEVIVAGVNPEGKAWTIGVAAPNESGTEMQDVVTLSNAALATSGNYRNFHTDSLGRRVAHTIDPRLGHPVQQSLLSATVKAATCAQADAYATAFMVMGLEATKAFVSKHPELQVYLIYAQEDNTFGTYSTLR